MAVPKFVLCISLISSLRIISIFCEENEVPVLKAQEYSEPKFGLDLRHAVESYFNGQFSAQNVSPETINDFHEKIRRKFSILDLRPKDGCPPDGHVRTSMFYCPTPNPYNVLEWKCVVTDELCNGIPDCPGSEDEDPTLCLFWLAGQEQLRQLRKILVKYLEKDADGGGHPMSRFSFPHRINRMN